MDFTLHIETGGEAMQTLSDVADALERVASRLQSAFPGDEGTILDRNGNTVGNWKIV